MMPNCGRESANLLSIKKSLILTLKNRFLRKFQSFDQTEASRYFLITRSNTKAMATQPPPMFLQELDFSSEVFIWAAVVASPVCP